MAAPHPRRVPGAPGHTGADLAELVWLRALSSPHARYVESAAGARGITYGDLRAAVQRWSELLDDLGLAVGDTVGLAVSDPLDFAPVFLGVVAAGRMAAPIDSGATDAEILAVCRRTMPRLVVSDRSAPGGRSPEWVTMPLGTFRLTGADAGDASELPAPASGLGEHGGVVLSTSGTTGVPKVIHVGQGALLHTARAVAAHHGLDISDRGFSPLPLFHINAEVVGLLSTLVAGAALVLDDRFHRRGFWDVMAANRITWINAVPAILARLSEVQEGEAVPEGIRFARSASAPLPLPVLERFEQATGIPVVETYGMTEAASQITANPVRGPRKPGSVGRPVEVEVRVGAGGLVPGSVGPVSIRGSSVIRGYASPGYEDRFDEEGWLETGDLGYFDEDGDLFLVGRADDVINRGGEKIYPREVEDVILGDPAVAAVAVVGSDHEVLGKVPVAYLVVEGVDGPEERDLAEAIVARLGARCAEMLSRPKRPAAFHVVEQLPQGATGKIQRHAVREGASIYSQLVW